MLCLQAMANPPPCDIGRPDCGSPDGISGSKKGGNRRTHASSILRRITELVTAEYPEARWVWEAPNAKALFETGADLFVLLNRAGGYRRAKVIIHNLQVLGIEYETAAEPANPEPEKESFQLIAFEWAEAHIFELNTRCNEAIGQNLSELLIYADELPAKESWEDVCDELSRAGLEEVQCVPEGIKINLTQ